MANVCLPPAVRDKFTQALVAGKINPERLAKMTSEERHKLFAGIVGEGNAKFVNSELEAKLLLKNQQEGMLRWAKKMVNGSPSAKRDLISRIKKLDKVLNPEEEKAFLKDLAETKLGFGVTVSEARKIAAYSAQITDLEAKQRPDGSFPSEADRMAYGYAKVDMGQ